VSQVGGFIDGTLSFEGGESEVVLAAGTFAITKLLTIDEDYWQGWTIYEILRYAPQHNWSAYEEAMKTNPVLAKMMTNEAVVYSLGDWIAQELFPFHFPRLVGGSCQIEQRLLWVDSVELIWVTILSTYSNEKSEARILEAPTEAKSNSSPIGPPEMLMKVM
ncbi:hypothetical protein Dsin_022533, partial [Dipteronia sinensis]